MAKKRVAEKTPSPKTIIPVQGRQPQHVTAPTKVTIDPHGKATLPGGIRVKEPAEWWFFNAKMKKAAREDFIRRQRNRAAKLNALKKDKEFIVATKCIKRELKELRKADPKQFQSYFSQLTYLSIPLDPEKVRQVLAAIQNVSIRATLKQYVEYCARFNVSLALKKRSFRVIAHGPFESKFHVKVVNGRLRPADLDVRAEEEPVWPDIYESNVTFPRELEKLIGHGSVIGVLMEDEAGRSLFNELEGFAYDPAKLTFILHRGQQNYISCLIGEKVLTDTVWRSAGKVVTALQKEFYVRTKSGRPKDIKQFNRNIRQFEKKQSLTKTAAEMAQAEGHQSAKAVAVKQVTLSRTGTAIKRNRSAKRKI